MGAPTVGVVIPVYRSADYVRACLASVLAQTRPVDQLVLVDDRGGDDSIDVAERFLRERGQPYTLVTQPRNGGLGRARNCGLGVLHTDLVWFLDSDDTAHPDFVAVLTAALVDSGADFAVCRTQRVDETGRVLRTDEAAAPGPVVAGEVYATELLRGRAKAYACTKLYRRTLLGARPWPEDQAYEDLVPALRFALAAERVALVGRPLYQYLHRSGSISTTLAETTFDLFVVGDEVDRLLGGGSARQRRDVLAFRYRQVLTSVAHVAMRADHAAPVRPPLYDAALDRVRAAIDLREVPTLLRHRQFRSSVFAVLVKYWPAAYSAVLRWR